MRIVYLDGQYLKMSDQIIDAFTPGVFKAKGVFETMLGLDGVVLDVALHIKRLREGLKILDVKIPLINPLTLKEVLLRSQLSLARVRLMVWETPPIAGQAVKQTHMMVTALPYKVSTKSMYRVCLVKTERRPNDHWANVKSLDYGLFAEAFAKAQAQGFDEALLLNDNGDIFEASRANIFWVKDKVLYTPPLSSGCLNGITRQQVIKQAMNMDIAVKTKNLKSAILASADAAFITNSLIGIKPIDIKMISHLSTRK